MKNIEKQNCRVTIEKNKNGGKNIEVSSHSNDFFISRKSCTTKYSQELIEKILNIKGPAYLCDEICREEDPNYVENHLKKGILSTIKDTTGLRILDFGCGAGSSTIILNRIFKQSEIVGIELEKSFLEIANLRKKFYKAENVEFKLSPNSNDLPDGIGKFDVIIFSAVFEHLLPEERDDLFPKVFSRLKSNGILYLDQTPHRYWFVESHTTGLPLINYLPSFLTLHLAKTLSKRNLENCDWNDLLRKGIRGGTVKEIKNILKNNNFNFELIEPEGEEINDQIDLWLKISSQSRPLIIKRFVYMFLKSIYLLFGVIFIPSLTISIKNKN